MSLRRLPPPMRRATLAFVLLALAVGQMLGAMHAIVHAPRLLQAGAAVVGGESHGGVAALFAGHAGHDRSCDLYDQLGHADALVGALPALPAALGAALPPIVRAAPVLAATALAHLARGPPSDPN